jgi:hypothetical protein
MKPKIKVIAVLWLFGLIIAGTAVSAAERTKKYNESWPVNSVQTLEINNRFGEVKVTHKGGNNVTIDVLVTVEASNERRAEELLDLINVKFGKTGNTVTAETHISRSFQSRQKFSIDYEVNIPPDKNLRITNKYGNTFVNVLNAYGVFDIQYGNFTANELNASGNDPVEFKLAYGKSDIETARNMNVTVQYSSMNFGRLNDLKLNSKYTKMNIDNLNSVEAESRYDTFNFGKVNSVSANTRYTQIKVEELSQNLKVDAGYGGIKVGKVNQGFNSISITNSYGQISLGLGNANYSLDASCDYCGISYPESNFAGDRMSHNQSRTVRGKVGNGSGGSVFVKSRYGQINLD